MDGTLHRDGDTFMIRFERILNHPIEHVWAALTERKRLAEWLGPTAIDLRPGGAIRIEFSGVDPVPVLETVVDEIDPPRVLQFRFDDGPGNGNLVRFELADSPDAHPVPRALQAGTGRQRGWLAHANGDA